MNATDGTLSSIAGSPWTVGSTWICGVAAHPNGSQLFVSEGGDSGLMPPVAGTLHVLDIDANTGALTQRPALAMPTGMDAAMVRVVANHQDAPPPAPPAPPAAPSIILPNDPGGSVTMDSAVPGDTVSLQVADLVANNRLIDVYALDVQTGRTHFLPVASRAANVLSIDMPDITSIIAAPTREYADLRLYVEQGPTGARVRSNSLPFYLASQEICRTAPLPMLNASCINVAVGKSYTGNGDPAIGADLDYACANWNAGGFSGTWGVDLGEPMMLSAAVLIPERSPATGTTTYAVETSLDGQAWTAQVNSSSPVTSAVPVLHEFASPVEARYVQVTASAGDTWIAWREIAVLQCAP